MSCHQCCKFWENRNFPRIYNIGDRAVEPMMMMMMMMMMMTLFILWSSEF